MQLQQDRLFVLIKSLNQGEKVYFSKYSRVHHAKEKPDYLHLFEFIDTQEEYDEKAIKKHFKKEKFIQQLPRKKTQLKEKIMESLTIFHADRTVEASLRKQMVLLPVLYEKASQHKDLIKDYEKQIKDIKKTAEKHECFSVLIELFEWEWLLLRFIDNNKGENNTISLLESRKICQDKLNQELDLEDVAVRTKLVAAKDPKFKISKKRQYLKEKMSISMVENNPDDLSKIAKRSYYYAKSGYHSFENDWESAHLAAKNLIHTYSKEDISDILTASDYKRYLCHYLVLSHAAKKFEEYPSTIEKIKRLSAKNDIYTFNTTRFKMLVYYLMKSDFICAIDVVREIENKWDELYLIVSKGKLLAYHYNIIVAYWFGKNIDEAIYWLSKIFTFENSPEGQHFVNLCRIIQLPIYYDCEDENIENRIESARKVLAGRKELSTHRQIIISGFRKLVRCINKQEKKDCINDIQQKLISIKAEESIHEGDLECLLLWCKLKIDTNKSKFIIKY